MSSSCFIRVILNGRGLDIINAIFEQGSQQNRINCLTVIARVLNNRPELQSQFEAVFKSHFCKIIDNLIQVAIETTSPLPKLIEQVFLQLDTKTKKQACGLFNSYFESEPIIPLLDLRVTVRTVELSYCKETSDIKALEKRSAALNSLSHAKGDVGDVSSALTYAKRAIEIHSQLATKNASRYEPNLAVSLSNYATYLQDNGQIEQALNFAKRALDIRKRLAKINPKRYEPYLAISLNNYANYLSRNGETEDALGFAQQAFTIRERLAKTKPERYNPVWANTLSNYASSLSDNGQIKQALGFSQQAVSINEQLAKAQPERYEPALARSLNNYAKSLSDNGQTEDALGIAQQSFTINKRLAKAKPDRYESDWAGFLRNYSFYLSENGQTKQALGFVKKALEIDERLPTAKPERYQLNWAHSLSNYASHLSDDGQTEQALYFIEQAMVSYQKLATLRPKINLFVYLTARLYRNFYFWLHFNEVNERQPALDCSDLNVRQKSELDFFSCFVELITKQTFTLASSADEYWQALAPDQQRMHRDKWLLLASIKESHNIAITNTEQWRQKLADLKKQRQGALPQWMLQVANRLKLTL